MKLLLLLLPLVVCLEFHYSTNVKLSVPHDTPINVDLYGPGANGYHNGTGGGSGGFIRAIIYTTTDIDLEFNSNYTKLQTGDIELIAYSGKGIHGGKTRSNYPTIVNLKGNSGTDEQCIGARCNKSPCLKGCQGRPLKQQIIPGSGGLSPYHISLDGTILDNPYFEDEDRYIDSIYTTKLLNCCGEEIKCATECVNGINGSYGNGGSGALNTNGGTCDGISYQPTNCQPGMGGGGYAIIMYEILVDSYIDDYVYSDKFEIDDYIYSDQSEIDTYILIAVSLIVSIVAIFVFTMVVWIIVRAFSPPATVVSIKTTIPV